MSLGIALYFGKTLKDRLNYVRKVLNKVSEGDLTSRVEKRSKCEIGEVNDAISVTIDKLEKRFIRYQTEQQAYLETYQL